jgi:hypothetical protein
VSVESDVDALYALPLDDFTVERNALAKRLAKEDPAAAAEVKQLTKPNVPAWAVNQLVRREPKLVELLLKGGEQLQQQVLRGQGGAEALRAAQQREREAVRNLVSRAEGVLRDAGRPATAQTLERISETLTAGAQTADGREALRSGRLSAELERPGFEALAGLAPRASRPRDELGEARRAKESRQKERRRLEDERRKLERQAAAAERDAERAEREAGEARAAAEKARAAADEAVRTLAELD